MIQQKSNNWICDKFRGNLLHQKNIYQMCFCTIVLILDGKSEFVVYVRSNLCRWICLGRLIKIRAVKNRIVSSEKFNFPWCVRNMFWVTIWTSAMFTIQLLLIAAARDFCCSENIFLSVQHAIYKVTRKFRSNETGAYTGFLGGGYDSGTILIPERR